MFVASCGHSATTAIPAPSPFSSTETVVYRFQKGAQEPFGGVLAFNGVLYGTTRDGGGGCPGSGCGTIYELNPANQDESVLYRFKGRDGAHPYGTLIALNGVLYGTTEVGGFGCAPTGCGTIFGFNPATKSFTTIFKFDGSNGAYPHGTLLAHVGNLYGTTSNGGDACPGTGCGTVFEINPTQRKEKILWRFTGNEGAHPYGGLTFFKDSFTSLYGTTVDGGRLCGGSGCGTVFSIHILTHTNRVIYRFRETDGDHPYSDLVVFKGLLWGTTRNGGSGNGTLFAVDPASMREMQLYKFTGGSNGAYPYAGLLLNAGKFYGTTLYGGNGGCRRFGDGCGTVFSFDASTSAESVLYAFTDSPDGAHPFARLTSANGKLYGTTRLGGNDSCFATLGCGIVFSVTP